MGVLIPGDSNYKIFEPAEKPVFLRPGGHMVVEYFQGIAQRGFEECKIKGQQRNKFLGMQYICA